MITPYRVGDEVIVTDYTGLSDQMISWIQKCNNKGIVDFIVSKGSEFDINNRKSFEKKETTSFLKSKKDELLIYLKQIHAL